MRTRYYPITLLLLFASMLLVVTCSKNSGPVEPSQNNPNGLSTLTIGSSGGRVEDRYGASISIPVGAVSSNLSISVRTIHADSIPSELQSGIVGNIIECLPHGATFLQPVTIILPVTSGFTYQAGDTANLFIYIPDSSAWEMTTIPAVVTADGQHLQASVSHFSNFGSNTSGRYGGGGSGFNNIRIYTDFEGLAGRWAARFLNNLGGIGVKKRIQNCCYKLENMQFIFRLSSPSYTGVCTITEGSQASCDKTENYHCSQGTPSDGYHLDVSITACWSKCEPDMSFSVSPSHFCVPDDRGKTADVTAKVTCGNGPGSTYSGESVKFVVASGPGQVGPPFAKTNSAGVAAGTYTVDNRGTSTIRAEVQTCQSISTTTANVVVDTLIPDHIYAMINIRHQKTDMPWFFNDRVEMMLIIDVEDENVTITGGEGSHYATCTATDGDCSIVDLSAPNFTPTGIVTKIGDSLKVEFNPNLAIVTFKYSCDFGDGDGFSRTYFGYSSLVSSIIAMNVKGTIKMELGSFVQGFGSEDFGEDMPLYFEFEIVYGTRTHP